MKNIMPGLTAEDAMHDAQKVQSIIQSGQLTREGIGYINKLAMLTEEYGSGYVHTHTFGYRIDMKLNNAMEFALKNAFGVDFYTAQYMAMNIRAWLRDFIQTEKPAGELRIFVDSLVSTLK